MLSTTSAGLRIPVDDHPSVCSRDFENRSCTTPPPERVQPVVGDCIVACIQTWLLTANQSASYATQSPGRSSGNPNQLVYRAAIPARNRDRARFTFWVSWLTSLFGEIKLKTFLGDLRTHEYAPDKRADGGSWFWEDASGLLSLHDFVTEDVLPSLTDNSPGNESLCGT